METQFSQLLVRMHRFLSSVSTCFESTSFRFFSFVAVGRDAVTDSSLAGAVTTCETVPAQALHFFDECSHGVVVVPEPVKLIGEPTGFTAGVHLSYYIQEFAILVVPRVTSPLMEAT